MGRQWRNFTQPEGVFYFQHAGGKRSRLEVSPLASFRRAQPGDGSLQKSDSIPRCSRSRIWPTTDLHL